MQTNANPAGTTFWLAPGVHTLGDHDSAEVVPRDENVYLGAPGSVLDGRGRNPFAFTQQAENVTIRHLEIRGFVAAHNEGVVNRDSGDGWIIEHNVIEENSGAGLMAGSRQTVRGNCLRNNGQYAMNAYQAGSGITDLVLEGNEISGNNVDDWEARIPDCGCSGGVKFWAVDGADIRDNWIHDNRGPGLWADTNNNDFLIEGNLIENNDQEAIVYEISYNAVIRSNVIRRNALVAGREYARRQDPFPIAAIYLSESGGDDRVPARTAKIEIYDNVLDANWGGITAWEDAGRFCRSPASTTSDCPLVLGPDRLDQCVQPGIAVEPLYSDCRWKTKNVDVHHNTFRNDLNAISSIGEEFAGRMSLLSNRGGVPEWSPYVGDAIKRAVTFRQGNRWRDNVYIGPWTFVALGSTNSLNWDEWRDAPFNQDSGSTFDD